ncbi:MAG TPA: hypothetical protein VHY81_01975 [Acidimicrobiales bacterium]|nr:hypothetical protein [Acidimicrobiales bacterium]
MSLGAAPAEELNDTSRSARHAKRGSDRRRFTVAMSAGLGAACVPYLWVLWGGSLSLLRTDFPGNAFSNFYDLQARALFHGHWNVPNGALGIESFNVHGQSYTYFMPLPSLLRMPVLLFTSSLDGRLTALSMLVAWIITGVFVSLLLWRVRLLVRGDAPLGRAEAVGYGFTVAAFMGGTVLVYLASAPYVYNEDFSWAVATGVGALFALLGLLEHPSRRRFVLLAVLLVAVNLSRLTVAWGCDIGTLLAAAWFASGRGGEEHRRWAWPTLAVGLVPLLLGCYVTWAKFGYPIGLPMADQVWTQIDPHRQQFLAANDGKAFSPTFIPTTALAYLRPDGLRLTDVFPYVTMPARPPAVMGGVVMDMSYRTASASASMPLVFLLAVWGAVASFRRNPAGRTALVRIPMLAAAAATAGVFVWGYVANRYLSDLLPLLFVAGAVGIADIWRRLDGRPPRVRTTWAAVIAALAVLSVLFNVALSSTPADVGAWQGTKVQSYVQTQEDLSSLTGNSIASNVVGGQSLPAAAPADTIFVLDDCAGLFLSNGEQYNPWIPVSLASPFRQRFSVTFTRPATTLQQVALVKMGRDVPSTVLLEYYGSKMRVVFSDPLFFTTGFWTSVKPGTRHHLDVVADVPRQSLTVDIDGHLALQSLISSGEMQITRYSGSSVPPTIRPPFNISVEPVAKSPLCTSLLRLKPGLSAAPAGGRVP